MTGYLHHKLDFADPELVAVYDGPQLRKDLCSRKLDKCGPVLLMKPEKMAQLSIQLDYRRSFWQETSANPADNSLSPVQNSTDKIGIRHS